LVIKTSQADQNNKGGSKTATNMYHCDEFEDSQEEEEEEEETV
jgi:hypothetical protein